VWLSDITYINVGKNWLYLTIVMDLYDRKVIGRSMSNGMSTEETTVEALNMAIRNRAFDQGLIFILILAYNMLAKNLQAD
jgi:putative transposase